jgi:dehydrogenase/reductase SDR family member 12
MSRIRNSIIVDRSIEDVFAVLTDVEKTGIWFPGDVKEHWTSPPPYGVGSTRHAVITMFGRRTENDAVATEYDPPHRAVMAGTSPNAPFVTALDFRPEGSGTRVEATTDFNFQGAQRIVGSIFTRLMARQWDQGLATLKRMMESEELGPESDDPKPGA